MRGTAMSALRQAKNLARKELKKRIAAMGDELKAKESSVIAQKLFLLDEYKNSKRISVYLNMPSEVSTVEILKDCFTKEKKVFIPQYVGDTMNMLLLSSYEDIDALPLTAWNIRQPADDDVREEALSTGGLDMIIVPGLGFSKTGDRLGRGKGYYDNYLCKSAEVGGKAPMTVALAFSTQMREEVPVSSEDVPVNLVLTCD